MIYRDDRSVMANTLPALIFLITVYLLAVVIAQGQQDTPHICSNNNRYAHNTVHGANLENLLSSLPTSINSSTGFYNASTGQFGNRVYAKVLCRGDVQFEECQKCARTVASSLFTLCPNNTQGVVWEDECMLRYSDNEIVGLVNSGFEPYWRKWKEKHAPNPKQFQDALLSLLRDLQSKAVGSNISTVRVAAGNTSGPDSTMIYALVQCTPDLDPNDCNTCLNNVSDYLIPACPCYNRTGGAIFLADCFLQYDDRSFFDESKLESLAAVSAPSPNGDQGVNKTRVIIPVVVSISVLLAVVIFVVILLRRRRKYKRFKQPESEATEDIKTVPSPENFSGRTPQLPQSNTLLPSQNPSRQIEQLHKSNALLPSQNTSRQIEQLDTKCQPYAYSEIKEATQNFSREKMLGTGGFGTVFKGVLPDRKEIAVKRLSEDSTQGDEEFENEVSSLIQVRHKNLVTLFGYSIEGKERVLVYEFLAMGSLDHYIFDSKDPLDWLRRYKIIQGIAGGLLYLHEGLPKTIIHFDLKASNILLEESLNPKIGDFGLAKLLGREKTHATTGNKDTGTRGYMAPEYVAHGNYSDKSDVFSFGVLLLEIISGKRRNRMNEEDLVRHAFECWHNGTKEDIVDRFLMSPSAGSGSPMSNIQKCINIGLLCVELERSARPTMLQVHGMLSNLNSITVLDPSQASYNYWMDRSNSEPYRPSQSNEYASKNTMTLSDEFSGR